MNRMLACTLAVFCGVAFAQDDQTTRTFFQRLIKPMPEVTGRDTQVFIGQLPPQFPLTPPPKLKVIGSIVNTEHGGSLNRATEVHFDAAMRAVELRQYVKTHLSGWTERAWVCRAAGPVNNPANCTQSLYRKKPNQALDVQLRVTSGGISGVLALRESPEVTNMVGQWQSSTYTPGRMTVNPNPTPQPFPSAAPVQRGLLDAYHEGQSEVRLVQDGNASQWRLERWNLATGKRIWQVQGPVGQPKLLRTGQGEGAVVIEITWFEPLRGQTLLYRLSDGKRLLAGDFEVSTVKSGLALVLPVVAPPENIDPSERFDHPKRLYGRVLELQSGKTLTANFPIPARKGCGPVKMVSQDVYDRLPSHTELSVKRQDNCGTFLASFDWAKVPLPPAKVSAVLR